MLHRTERTLENIPVGSLGMIPIDGCQELGGKVNDYLVKWRKESISKTKDDVVFHDYQKETYIIDAKVPRFGSGEAKGIINESVRGKDIYLMVDVCNYSLTYSLSGHTNHMSPDDHFQNLKRVIAAIGGKARRINVIMPFLYESRQHKRSSRESLDCALALQELVHMGVDNIITFDAHDPRVQNAIPLNGFETVRPTYQFIKGLLQNVPDLKIDSNHMMAISPDEGATGRAIYLANVLGLDMGMFYKRRDYTRIVDGRNPIVAHEFLGSSVEGKDVIIIDDMISSGDSILDVAKQLKDRKANRIFAAATFGLFTNGMKKFDEAYEQGIIHGILTTNLIYQTPNLLSKPYYINCDMSKYIALLIDTLNHDGSISSILNPSERIQNVDLKIDSNHMMAISPDEGATGRAIYLANVLGLDMGMFYKRRDYTRIVDGRNPIVAHEFLGSSVEGKDVIIIDDMISSGDSILDVAKQLKDRKANRIFAAATFGLFTNGMKKFDEAYEQGIIHGILTTNLIYQTPNLLSKPYYINCDMSKYIALLIDTLNHDGSISSILNPSERIQNVLTRYKNGEEI